LIKNHSQSQIESEVRGRKSKEKREFSLKTSSTSSIWRLNSPQFWLFFKDLKVNAEALGHSARPLRPKGRRAILVSYSGGSFYG
jgi:hypothetical protein